MSDGKSNYQEKWRLEKLARTVRTRMGLAATDLLDPWRLADLVPAHIFTPDDLVSPELASSLRTVNWDGFAFGFPNEVHLMILLNPARSPARQQATLLEEVSHHLLGHPPSRIFIDPQTGLRRRTYDRAQEAEAYELGSMLLLPKEVVQEHVKSIRGTAEELANWCGASVQVVEFRIKRCRLWNRYRSYMEGAARR